MKSQGWDIFERDDGRPCIVPKDDLRPHDIEGECWCDPINDEGILVHNSLDEREHFEEGRRKPS